MGVRTGQGTRGRLGARTGLVSLALLLGGASVGVAAPAVVAGSGAAAPGSHNAHKRTGETLTCDPFLRSELFFGTGKPDGSTVSDEEFEAFVDREVTPRFPDGLTVVPALGQFRGAGGQIVKERSKLLILLYAKAMAHDDGVRIEQIRTAYEQAFQQESVLRSDDPSPSCVSF